MGVDQLAGLRLHRRLAYRALHLPPARTTPERRLLGSGRARLDASVPLTRSREARKGRAWKTGPRRSSSTATICAARSCGSRTRSSRRTPGDDSVALVGIHTRGAVLGRRLHALVGELSGSEVPLGDLDISFYRDDVGAREPGAQPVVHASHLDFDLARPHDRAGRRRHVHRPHRPRGDRRPVRLRAPGAGPARGARRPRPPRAADPAGLRRQEPADGPRRARLRPPRGDRRRRRGGDRAGATGPGGGDRDEAPALDRGPRARRHRADHGAGRELRRGRSPRHQEGPDPSRPHDRQPVLSRPARARARRSSWPRSASRPTSSRSRRAARRSRRASRSRTRSRRSRPTARRRSSSAARRRRRGAGRGWTDAAVVNAGDGKHEHPSQALLDLLHAATAALGPIEGKRIWIVGDVLHSRVARSGDPGFTDDGRRGHGLRAADPDPARDRGGARGATSSTTSTASPRPTWSTRCGCSASA